MTHKNRSGFTLMELMIVLAIIIALFAILLPAVFSMRSRWLGSQAQLKVDNLSQQLELYVGDNRGYPTNEQGLCALIFIPDNIGVLQTIPQAGAMGATDPSFGGMAQGSVSVGAEALTNPAAPPMSMTPPAGAPQGMTDPMAMSAGGMNPAAGGMMTDPNAMAMGMPGTGGMTASTWTQVTHNPQLYLQRRKRPDSKSYAVTENDLIDPWGTPYRYDNSLRYYGFNQTGSAKPAVWSAGPDKADNTDDDIRNWDPVEAQNELTLRQQQQSTMGMGAGQAGTVDPTTGMPMDPNSMMMQQPMPGQTMPMQTMPGQTMPGQAMPGQAMPGQAMPMQPGTPPPAGMPPMTPNPATGMQPPMTPPMPLPGGQTPAPGGITPPM